MPKKVSESQKKEMAKSFISGISIHVLSEKYNCTVPTIIRNLKKSLGDTEYKEFLNKGKSLEEKSKKNQNQNQNQNNDSLNFSFDNEDLKNDYIKSRVLNENSTAANIDPINSFFEIAPIDYEIDNSSRKELSSVPISEIDFPKVVYMVVDKKIELEIKLLKDFPEWQFLPQDDLSRKAIEIFFDLNLAKRSCNKEQKVLKIPNTDVFRIAAPVLISKGISRIVCAENLIAL